jgi:hypothetical protein
MTEWLLRSIGVGDEIRTHLDHAVLLFQRPLVLWVGLVLFFPAAWYVYRRQRQNLASISRGLQVGLSVTRALILAILVIVLSGPYLRLDEKKEKRPLVAWIFDQSQSMALPAGPFSGDEDLAALAAAVGYPTPAGKVEPEVRKALERTSRAQLAAACVAARREDLIRPLAKRYELRFYSAAERLEQMPVAGPDWKLPEPRPRGASTRLGDAVGQLVEDAAGRQIAGIVVFSDGQNNAGRSLVEAARAAGDAAAPIFAVPAGSEAPLRDVAVTDVFAPDLVSMGDTVRVSVTLELQGYAEQAVKVSVVDEGAKETLDAKDLLLRSTETQSVDLTFEAKRAGSRTLTVKVTPTSPLPEDIPDNNSDSIIVRVSGEKLKVLYVEGPPRWQFRFLKNAMRRDHGLAGLAAELPDIVLENEARRHPAAASRLPKSVEELARYHTVILGDVSPQLADGKFLSVLDEAVRRRGVGLIVAAGPISMPSRYPPTLTGLLPVRTRAGAGGMEAPAYKPFRLEVSPDGAVHDTMRMYDDPGRNEIVWTHMPPFYWCAAVERPAAGATVLAYNPSVVTRWGKLPLVAHHFAGQGKVLFLGMDSTWTWRQNVGDRFFYKFWGQAIRFVARREEQDLKRKDWLEARPARAQQGEQVQIELMAFTPDGTPRREPTLPLEVAGAAGNGIVELAADRATPGRYSGRLLADVPGTFRLQYIQGSGSSPLEAHVQVATATEELRRPNVNLPALKQLGKIVRLQELKTIADNLRGETKVTELHREATIWDNWLLLVILICVYSLDVGLRRLAGLT